MGHHPHRAGGSSTPPGEPADVGSALRASGPDSGVDRAEDAQPAPAEAAPLADELADRLRRALADQENMRKRYERQIAAEREAERTRVATAFLPVVDHLDLALAHADGEPSAVVDGVRAVRDQALATLSSLGFPRRDDLGRPFDPMWHEAVSVVADTGQPDGTVVEVVRPGYGEADRQLRPAAVVVARG